MTAEAPETPSTMAVLAKSLAILIAVAAGGAARRAAATAAGYGVVALLFAISLGFLTFAGYGALSQAVGWILAALIVGCLYLFVGLIMALVLQARRR